MDILSLIKSIMFPDKEEAKLEIPKVLPTSYPPFAEKAALFLRDAREHFKNNYGRDLGIHMALRSFETQQKLYSIGRRGVEGEKIVTKAKAGLSFHNYGAAADFVFDGDTSKEGIQWSWKDEYPWKELGAMGEKYGLEWAGRWKSFPEMPHFQMSFGYTIRELQSFYAAGGIERVWREFDKKLKI